MFNTLLQNDIFQKVSPWWKRIASNWKMRGNRGTSPSTDIGARI